MASGDLAAMLAAISRTAAVNASGEAKTRLAKPSRSASSAVEVATGVGQFAGHAVADQARQALQRADVGYHPEVDLAHREHGVGRRIAHVAAGDEVERAADAGALDGGDDRLAAALEAAQAVLQVEDQPAQGFAAARPVGMGDALLDAAHHGEIDAGAEIPAFAAEDGDADRGGCVDPREGLADFLPHRVVHRVRLVRAVEADFGDAVGEATGGVRWLRKNVGCRQAWLSQRAQWIGCRWQGSAL